MLNFYVIEKYMSLNAKKWFHELNPRLNFIRMYAQLMLSMS
jgi:hypothetical protein